MQQRRFQSASALVADAIGCDAASLGTDSAITKHPSWDSISHLNVMMLLEEEFGVEINEASIMQFTTLPAIERLFSETAN